MTAEKLKEIFSEKGEVTDVQLKYTKDGKFRNFGFIGYRNDEQAAIARDYFDSTCINSMKISVETCANLGDEKKPRAWSKYAPDSSAYKALHKTEIEAQAAEERKKNKKKKEKNNKEKIKELLRKHKDDPLFAEFIAAHVNDKTVWVKEALEKLDSDDGENDSGTDEETITKVTENDIEDKKKAIDKTANKNISDLDYMKILMKKESVSNEDTEITPKKIRHRPLLYVKLTGLPYRCKKRDIKDFFRPLVPFSIRLPLGKEKKLTGFSYVGFRTEAEFKKALDKNKLFLGSHRIHVHKFENKKEKAAAEEEELNKRKNQQKETNEESIGESGSIFIRNLPYIVSEDELTKLFEKYGPIAEVNMPIDKILRQPKGFATITFVMPEHAVHAYSELDGTAFCGRMMHLLPAKTDKNVQEDSDVGLSFKEKKAKQLKAQAKSSHNWNTLFLGANAVADVVASNYNTTKEHLLMENSKNTSVAVRLALGETQLVAETKSFLETNGVYLDAFNKPAKKRSKTCILVKNLPANTTMDEIKPLFEKHGHIARFIMPKHGITVLVDFVEPFEAKKAFSKLAYSQFKSSPLYLEWAPENVFNKTVYKVENTKTESEVAQEKEVVAEQNEKKDENVIEKTEIKEESEDIEPENDTTLFVKNLNFKTSEELLRKHFSSIGKLHNVTIAKKKDPKNPGQVLSMGYGFVQYYTRHDANKALKELQCSNLDGKTLELKRSERGNTNEIKTSKKTSKSTEQNGTKILVRNVPFQANRNELHEIFRVFGEIKTLRLPKKLTPGADQHRGFAFVDFYSKADAKSAFEALCQSTHLYGRRLVLEWADQTDEGEDVDNLRKRTAQTFYAKTPGGKKSKKSTVDVETFVEE